MKFISFGSGSCGNCYYLLEDGFGLIIDMGIGIRSLKKYMREYGFSASQLQAALVTHDHTDHVKGIGSLANDARIPVYATIPVHRSIGRNPFVHKKIAEEQRKAFTAGDRLQIGPFEIATFSVPHDASDNCGFDVRTATSNLCLMTDVGRITEEMSTFISKAENLVIEANYDEAMLENGPYPAHLKRRIASGKGHCSNKETANALAKYLTPCAKRVWLCHLSEENNHPELARKTVESALQELESIPQLHVLKRRVPSEIFEL